MVCITLHNKRYSEILEALALPEVEMAEIRLDSCILSPEETEDLFMNCDLPLVATCRISGIAEKLKREQPDKTDGKIESQAYQVVESKLMTAIRAGAAYADLEIEAPAMLSKRIRRAAREYGAYLIRSYHDFSGTDSEIALKALVEKCLSLGADAVKIVTTANCEEDVERVGRLYRDFEANRLIAFCMGSYGKHSRITCLEKGAPFSYAALTEDDAAAPGQWSYKDFHKAVYGDFKAVEYGDENYPVIIPCSKSIAQRAIIAAALANGTSELRGYSPCGDNESAISVAEAIGAEVTANSSTLTIKGIGAGVGIYEGKSLSTGESGLLTRMMIPVLGAIGQGEIHVDGEGTLLKRPLRGAEEIMQAFGITLEGGKTESGIRVPLTVKGRLCPGEKEISGKDGSQLISGLLAALPLLEEDSIIHIREPKSIPYIFMTIDVLKKFGIRINSDMEGGDDFLETLDWDLCEGITLHVKGGQSYKAADFSIEADWSSAANFMVAGAVFGSAALQGPDTASLQADLSVMDILAEAGACLSQEEDTGIIHVCKAPLSPFEIDAGNCPDLFPIISVLAAFCEGTSRISGVGRLSSKESDRGKAIIDMLSQMGVNAAIKGDTMTIAGHSLSRRILSGNMLKGGSYTSHHDHRMVMALMVAGLGADSKIEIDDTDCVRKSFPKFIELFERL